MEYEGRIEEENECTVEKALPELEQLDEGEVGLGAEEEGEGFGGFVADAFVFVFSVSYWVLLFYGGGKGWRTA